MRLAVGLVVLAACGGAPAKGPVAKEPAGKEPVAVVVPAKPAEPVEAVPADPRVAADLKAFDVMWQRVADLFYDPAYGGVDWKAVKRELRPRILTTKTREESRAIMNEALERLGKSHFGVSGPLDDEDPGAAAAADAGIGVELRVLGGAVVVTRIEAGSNAEQAKLRLGSELVTVDQVPVAPRIADVAAKLPPSALVPMFQIRAVGKLLRGKPGTKVALGVKLGTQTSTISVERAHLGNQTSLGNLGSHRVVYDAKRLEPKVGYIRLSIFLDPPAILPRFAADLAGFAGTAGVIIDLRGNPGGIGGMALGMAGYLVSDANKKLGTMRTRESALDFVINPQAQRYAGKVAILIDEHSASTSEIFAGGLQDLGRARVFGRRSPGAALPSTIEALPNGDRFQYAIADYTSTSGKVLEGNGVTPDVPITLDVKALRNGTDPDVAAATRWIKEKP